MTRRFSRLAASLGHNYTLHSLRHSRPPQLGAVAEAAPVRERVGHRSPAVSRHRPH